MIVVAVPHQTEDFGSPAVPLASDLFSWGKVGFVSGSGAGADTRDDSFVTARPQFRALLCTGGTRAQFGLIPCRSSGMNNSSTAISGQKNTGKVCIN